MPNRLQDATSPYLLQHANNPVDWYPWCDEALERARDEDKPIFLSIGYSACHWCHVMEHESFEDATIAAFMNQHFVCVKVDREERPDLDQIYMLAVQLMTGRGGWPMSVFLTPELEPFFGGTYWPPHSRQGLPGFDQVLGAVDDAWRNRREQARQQAAELTANIRRLTQPPTPQALSTTADEALRAAAVQLESVYDMRHGGFGDAPKFPHPMDLQVLLRLWRKNKHPALLEMVQQTLLKMALGGIYDHLGGGFARYSVDARWLVPHFEKMLYDNALLTGTYLDAYQATGDASFAATARETLNYVLRDMTSAEGGFYSTEDADSEGVEGKFYVWSRDEVFAVLGAERASRFCEVYDVTESGNFEGRNILNLPRPFADWATTWNMDETALHEEMQGCRALLFAAREKRTRPGRDDKVIVSWNSLMIDSLARAAAILDEPRYLRAAQQAASFLLAKLRDNRGRLLHVWRQGRADLPAYLDDYACLANALITLYQADFNERWIASAVELVDTFRQHFADPQGGGFYYTADDHEALITRAKDLHDGSVPSANAMAATVLVRLGKLIGRRELLDEAGQIIASAATVLERSPRAVSQLLIAMDMLFNPFHEIVIVGNAGSQTVRDALAQLRASYLPNHLVACRPADLPISRRCPDLDPLFEGRMQPATDPAVFICQDHTCQTPVSSSSEIRSALTQL